MTIHYIHIEDSMPRGDVMRVMSALYDHARRLTDVGSIVTDLQLSTSDGVARGKARHSG